MFLRSAYEIFRNIRDEIVVVCVCVCFFTLTIKVHVHVHVHFLFQDRPVLLLARFAHESLYSKAVKQKPHLGWTKDE